MQRFTTTANHSPSNVEIRLSGKFFLLKSSETSFTDNLSVRNDIPSALKPDKNLTNVLKQVAKELVNPRKQQPRLEEAKL